MDSKPVPLRIGAEDVKLRTFTAEDPLLAAEVYPANYWYSLMEVPAENEFPGTGSAGNGIGEMMNSQDRWLDLTKQGCQLCHQLGNKATRHPRPSEPPRLRLECTSLAIQNSYGYTWSIHDALCQSLRPPGYGGVCRLDRSHSGR